MPPFSVQWSLALRYSTLLNVEAAGVVFDSASKFSYMPPADFAKFAAMMKSAVSGCSVVDG